MSSGRARTGSWRGQGSLFRLVPSSAGNDYRSGYAVETTAQRRELYLRLLGAGVLISQTGLGCLSTVMDEPEVNQFVEAIRSSATAMAG